ncbi:MAG: hypothetical protein M1812_003617 [Candelaria pacifica]|nr:MAG: hypothetical protein M1812_003617 [Candelaria pacifica]
MPHQNESRSTDAARSAPAQSTEHGATAATVPRESAPQLDAYRRDPQTHEEYALGMPAERKDMAEYLKRWEEWFERAGNNAT